MMIKSAIHAKAVVIPHGLAAASRLFKSPGEYLTMTNDLHDPAFKPGDLLLLTHTEVLEPDAEQLAIVRLLHLEQGASGVYAYVEYLDPAFPSGANGRVLLADLRVITSEDGPGVFALALKAAERLSQRIIVHTTVTADLRKQQRDLEVQMGLLRENALRGRQTLLACTHNMTQATHLALDQLAEATAQHLATEERANTLERQLIVYAKMYEARSVDEQAPEDGGVDAQPLRS